MENTANQGNVPANQAGVENTGGQQPQAPAQPVQPQAPQAPQVDNSTSRTKEQFEKLLESNRKLFEANQQLQQKMETINQPQQPQVPQQVPTPQPQQVDPRDFIERDPVTGEQYINETKMKSRIREIEERASRAEQTINSFIKTAEQREIDRQNAEAFSAHPELNPDSDGFDKNLSRQVRSVIYDSLLNAQDYGGRPLSFKEAADFIKGQQTPDTTTPTQGGNESTGESAAPQTNEKKEQSSAQAMSAPQNAPQQTSSEELGRMRMATRMGDDSALAARIVAVEHTRPAGE